MTGLGIKTEARKFVKKNQGRAKNYLIKSINFGKIGAPARIVIERLAKLNPNKVSDLVSKAVVDKFGGSIINRKRLELECHAINFKEICLYLRFYAEQKAEIIKKAEKLGFSQEELEAAAFDK